MDLVESWLKLMEIDSKCIKISAIWMECMKFEVDVVWSLDPQLFERYSDLVERSRYCWCSFWDFVIWFKDDKMNWVELRWFETIWILLGRCWNYVLTLAEYMEHNPPPER